MENSKKIMLLMRASGTGLFLLAASQLSDLPHLLIRDIRGLGHVSVPAVLDGFVLASIALSVFFVFLGFLLWGWRARGTAAITAVSVFAVVWCGYAAVSYAGARKDQKTNADKVMSQGMWVMAKTSMGVLKINAPKGSFRTYMWGDCSFTEDLDLKPPRWNGSLGVYNRMRPRPDWKACSEVSRVVGEEGHIDFADRDTAIKWMHARAHAMEAYFDEGGYAASRDGLVMFWGKARESMQLSVDLWQISVGGQIPERFYDPRSDAPVLVKVI